MYLSWAIWISIFQGYFSVLAALNCYMCPRTDGQTAEEANIECLALGWNMSCSSVQDRCYSRLYRDTTEVEKGCGQSAECLDSTWCCQNSHCNAGPQSFKSGEGDLCSVTSDCIQGGTTMVCERDDPNASTKMCMCAEDSYQRGATCNRKSHPEEPCAENHHCYDINTTCMRNHCMCDEGMFSNGTTCDYQRRLGEMCTLDQECGGRNTACNDVHCACVFGYLVINGTNSCSDSPTIKITFSTILVLTTSAISIEKLWQGR